MPVDPDEKFSLVEIEMAFTAIPLQLFNARGGYDSKTGQKFSRFDAFRKLSRRLRGYADEPEDEGCDSTPQSS
jgi:hypothetical protein